MINRTYSNSLNAKDVATACCLAAETNHYLVGLAYDIPEEIAEAAKQILIDWENKEQIQTYIAETAFLILEQGSGMRTR